ncbi:MAG: DUF4339 domain-containing protein [Bacteroidales bacterium]|nr:DUF4339 domain-containing protein [Candidatus Physcousia equi]
MNDNNFYSIDRLVDFGLGIAMAQQMVGMMNHTMQNMQVPGSIATMPTQPSLSLYVAIDGKSVGPLSERDFTELVNQQKVNKDTLVWTPGMAGWKPLEQVPAALRIIALAPPPLPTTC